MQTVFATIENSNKISNNNSKIEFIFLVAAFTNRFIIFFKLFCSYFKLNTDLISSFWVFLYSILAEKKASKLSVRQACFQKKGRTPLVLFAFPTESTCRQVHKSLHSLCTHLYNTTGTPPHNNANINMCYFERKATFFTLCNIYYFLQLEYFPLRVMVFYSEKTPNVRVFQCELAFFIERNRRQLTNIPLVLHFHYFSRIF